jgi:hypothetical protein
MPQFGGKNAKKTKKTSSSSKRHFTVVIGNKEHGLYVSSTPSSAARKAVTKLCSANKSKKVEFYMREITQDSKKKTYGPYDGYIEKLKEPIELKGRVIKYKPVVKLSGKKSSKSSVKKGGMRGGNKELLVKGPNPYFIIITIADLRREYPFNPKNLVRDEEQLKNNRSNDLDLNDIKSPIPSPNSNRKIQPFKFRDNITEDKIEEFLKDETRKQRILKKFEELKIPYTVKIFLNIPYIVDGKYLYESILYLVYIPSGNIALSNNQVNQKNYEILNDMRERGIKSVREFEIYTKIKHPKLSSKNREKLRKDYEFFTNKVLEKKDLFNFFKKESNEEIKKKIFNPFNSAFANIKWDDYVIK